MRKSKPGNIQVVYDIQLKKSQYNYTDSGDQEDYFELTMFDPTENKIFTTYASPSNKNFKKWKPVVERLVRYPEYAVAIDGNFKFKKNTTSKKKIINADGDFKLEHDTIDLASVKEAAEQAGT